jgi:hypothetical protein
MYKEIDDIELNQETIHTLVDEYTILNKQKNEITKQLEQYKILLTKYAKRNNLKRLFGKKHQISLSFTISYKVLDKETLLKFMENKNLLNEIMTLNTASLRKVLRENNLTLPN